MSNRRRQFCDRRSLPGPREARLRATERLLCASLIIDVGEQAVPTGNAATVVLKWRDVGVHPPVDAIEAPHPDVIFQSPSECHTPEPLAVDALSIVRVNERETVDPLDVGLAGVVEKSFIRVLVLACRIDDQDQL